jgi:hypothetical protein
MTLDEVIKGLIDEEKFGNGIKCLKLLKIDNFEELKQEVLQIISNKPASVIGDLTNREGHYLDIDEITPYHPKVRKIVDGAWRAYRLYRTSPGWLENEPYLDANLDYNSLEFFYGDEFPQIKNLIDKFKNKFIVNLSGLLPNTALIPHNEPMTRYWKDKPSLVFRFHIPIIENPDSYFWFNKEKFYFEPGYIYLFNFGTIHSAYNNSNYSRYNLIVDCLANNGLSHFFENATIPKCFGTEDLIIDNDNLRPSLLSDEDRDHTKIFKWDDKL